MADPGGVVNLRLSRVLSPVTALGPGRRVAVWVQGCALACAGCASEDTWAYDGGTAVTVEDAIELLADEMSRHGLDGLTLTGGEPTDQAEALAATVTGLQARVETPLDVLLFTGRTLTAARARAAALLDLADCLVSGPYRPGEFGANRLLASANQEITWRSVQARARYEPWLADPAVPTLQVSADESDLFLIGLPKAGDLVAFEQEMRQRGVELAGVTWSA